MLDLEEPNYKLIFKDRFLVPKYDSKIKDIVKFLVLFFIFGGIILSLLAGGSIFSEISFMAWVGILSGVVYLVKHSGNEPVPSDCELWFYADRIVLYRPKAYYSKKLTRREYSIFLYKDIEQCWYRTVVGKIDIFGKVEKIIYEYDKDGNLKDTPSYHKTLNSMNNFYITLEPDIDFVKEIEEHSPIKVKMRES